MLFLEQLEDRRLLATLTVVATDADKLEGDSGVTPYTFTVTRGGDTSGTTTVDYAVTGSGTMAADEADFGGTFPSGTVSFAAGETEKIVTIDVVGDTLGDADEGFTVTLSNPSASDTILTSTADGLIHNDDKFVEVEIIALSVPSPNDSTVLPASLTQVSLADTFVAEVWVRDITEDGVGIVGGYVDVSYPTALLDAANLTHDSRYTFATSGTIDDSAGRVDDAGGGHATSPLPGRTPEHARLLHFDLTADAQGAATLALAPGLFAIGVGGVGNIDPSDVDFGSLTLNIIDDSPVLRISEIMYNPASAEPDWEWIELYNPGTVDVNLAGYVIDDDDGVALSAANIVAGIVPAGGTAVLFDADDIDASDFTAAWGTGINLVAVSDWSLLGLNNTGDRLGLWRNFGRYSGDEVAHNNTLDDVFFDDSARGQSTTMLPQST